MHSLSLNSAPSGAARSVGGVLPQLLPLGYHLKGPSLRGFFLPTLQHAVLPSRQALAFPAPVRRNKT